MAEKLPLSQLFKMLNLGFGFCLSVLFFNFLATMKASLCLMKVDHFGN